LGEKEMTAFSKKTGFTLVELLIVVLILAALAAIAVPRIGQSAVNARRRACQSNISIINGQIELYHTQEDAPPTDFDTLANNPAYFPSGPPKCPFGTLYVIGANGHITPHAH
jgi:prepilin-type N-terminal cleavage/methylation domain-containing protein